MSDIGVQAIGGVPIGAPVIRKPLHLIRLMVADRRKKEPEFFISLDKPNILNGFIEVKGIFVDPSIGEDEILKNFSSILTGADKGLISEVMFPWHRICSVRNLIFRAK